MENMITAIQNHNSISKYVKNNSQIEGGSAPGRGFNENSGNGYVGIIAKDGIRINGTGIKYFNKQKVYYLNNQPIIIYSIHKDSLAKISIINNDLTLSEQYLAKVDEIIENGENLHIAYKEAFLESLMNKPLEEKINTFVELYPDLSQKISVKDFIKWHCILTGACSRGALDYIQKNGLKLDQEYTINFSLKFVKNIYSPTIIERVINRYNN